DRAREHAVRFRRAALLRSESRRGDRYGARPALGYETRGQDRDRAKRALTGGSLRADLPWRAGLGQYESRQANHVDHASAVRGPGDRHHYANGHHARHVVVGQWRVQYLGVGQLLIRSVRLAEL